MNSPSWILVIPLIIPPELIEIYRNIRTPLKEQQESAKTPKYAAPCILRIYII
jgi:hypothetical protein